MHDKIIGATLPSVQALSFLGDAVHSLYVRRMLIEAGHCKSGDLNVAAQKYVTAEAQANMMRKIKPILIDDELDVYRRASNSTHLNRPKHAKAADYRAASGFEALLGMLEWIGDRERLDEILKLAHTEDVENDTED
jgi:ribonuclease-3 family protein